MMPYEEIQVSTVGYFGPRDVMDVTDPWYETDTFFDGFVLCEQQEDLMLNSDAVQDGQRVSMRQYLTADRMPTPQFCVEAYGHWCQASIDEMNRRMICHQQQN